MAGIKSFIKKFLENKKDDERVENASVSNEVADEVEPKPELTAVEKKQIKSDRNNYTNRVTELNRIIKENSKNSEKVAIIEKKIKGQRKVNLMNCLVRLNAIAN